MQGGGVCIRHGAHRWNDAEEKIAQIVCTKHGAKVNDAAVKDAQIMIGMDTNHVLKSNTTRRKQAAQIMLRMEERTCFKEVPDNAELALFGNELMSEGRGRRVGNNRNNFRRRRNFRGSRNPFAVILVTFVVAVISAVVTSARPWLQTQLQ